MALLYLINATMTDDTSAFDRIIGGEVFFRLFVRDVILQHGKIIEGHKPLEIQAIETFITKE